MCYYGIVEILKEHHNQQLINTLSGRNSKGFLFVFCEEGKYLCMKAQVYKWQLKD